MGRKPEANKVLELTQHKSQKWREIIADGVPLFENVENFIRKMSNDFALGIVSMSSRQDILHVLELTGLTDCFDIIVSAEDVTKCKPDPECYRIGFRELDLARIRKGHLPMIQSECVVIEDSPPGVQAGRAAELQVSVSQTRSMPRSFVRRVRPGSRRISTTGCRIRFDGRLRKSQIFTADDAEIAEILLTSASSASSAVSFVTNNMSEHFISRNEAESIAFRGGLPWRTHHKYRRSCRGDHGRRAAVRRKRERRSCRRTCQHCRRSLYSRPVVDAWSQKNVPRSMMTSTRCSLRTRSRIPV